MRYVEEIDTLRNNANLMACLGVENFAGSIFKLRNTLCLSHNGIDYIIEALIEFNNSYKNYYNYCKEFDELLSPIEKMEVDIPKDSEDFDYIEYFEDNNMIDELIDESIQTIPSYGMNGKLLRAEDVDLIVKKIVLIINDMADKIDH